MLSKLDIFGQSMSCEVFFPFITAKSHTVTIFSLFSTAWYCNLRHKQLLTSHIEPLIKPCQIFRKPQFILNCWVKSLKKLYITFLLWDHQGQIHSVVRVGDLNLGLPHSNPQLCPLSHAASSFFLNSYNFQFVFACTKTLFLMRSKFQGYTNVSELGDWIRFWTY